MTIGIVASEENTHEVLQRIYYDCITKSGNGIRSKKRMKKTKGGEEERDDDEREEFHPRISLKTMTKALIPIRGTAKQAKNKSFEDIGIHRHVRI